SIRRIDWHNARTGFFVLFRPGTLEKAPQMYIAAVNAPVTEPQRSRFQRALIDRYPNITIIDVADIIRDVHRILNTLTTALSFVVGFFLFCGILILTGSIAMTKFQRVYEAAVLKTLGAKRKTLLTILLIEYALLGLVSGIIGSAAGLVLSYFTGRHVFEISWY